MAIDKPTWQDHWFARKVLGEIPGVGPFLSEKSLNAALPKAFHSTFMLMGGVMLMAKNPFSLKMDGLGDHVGAGVIYMLLGMWAGAEAYHAAAYGSVKFGHLFHSTGYCLSKPQGSDQLELNDEKGYGAI